MINKNCGKLGDCGHQTLYGGQCDNCPSLPKASLVSDNKNAVDRAIMRIENKTFGTPDGEVGVKNMMFGVDTCLEIFKEECADLIGKPLASVMIHDDYSFGCDNCCFNVQQRCKVLKGMHLRTGYNDCPDNCPIDWK